MVSKHSSTDTPCGFPSGRLPQLQKFCRWVAKKMLSHSTKHIMQELQGVESILGLIQSKGFQSEKASLLSSGSIHQMSKLYCLEPTISTNGLLKDRGHIIAA